MTFHVEARCIHLVAYRIYVGQREMSGPAQVYSVLGSGQARPNRVITENIGVRSITKLTPDHSRVHPTALKRTPQPSPHCYRRIRGHDPD